MKLNLGCGTDYRQGWVNVDRTWPGLPNPPQVDEIVDLDGPWPWADGSADAIIAYSVFEHLDDVMHAMAEAHRVLKAGGHIRIVGPSQTSANWCADPTHKRAFNKYTFDCFDPETALGARAFNFWPKWKVLDRKDLGDDWLFVLEPR
jgi:SAM-dependent methyltransferase